MTKTYKHSGKIGDMMYSLPFIQANGGGELYIGLGSEFSQENFNYVYPLLAKQPYLNKVALYNGEHIDFDLDLFRNVSNNLGVNLVERYFIAHNQFYPEHLHLTQSLFVVPETGPKGHILVSRGHSMVRNFPFRHIFNDSIKGFIDRGLDNVGVFVGFESEHQDFCETYKSNIPFVKVKDALEMAEWIENAELVICNQNGTHAMAEMMKKTIFLECKLNGGDRFDCQFTRPNLFYI